MDQRDQKLINAWCRVLDKTRSIMPDPAHAIDQELKSYFEAADDAVIIDNTVADTEIAVALDKWNIDKGAVPAIPFENFMTVFKDRDPRDASQVIRALAMCTRAHYGKLREGGRHGAVMDVTFVYEPGSFQNLPHDHLFKIQGYLNLQDDNYMGVGPKWSRSTHSVGEHEPVRLIQHSTFDPRIDQDVFKTIGSFATTLRRLLMYLDLPKHHVIVQTPHTYRESNGPKIRRADDREQVIVVCPEDVHRIYKSENAETERTVAPHKRRGYTKLLRSNRWKHKQGQRVVVRPTWVGPESWVFNKTRYRIVRPNEPESHT